MFTAVRFAARQLIARPGFSLLAILSLALGLALVTVQFSLIDGMLLRGLPIPDAGNLVHISRALPDQPGAGSWESLPVGDLFELSDAQQAVGDLAAINFRGFNLSEPSTLPSRHTGAATTSNLARLLRVTPQLGRWFSAAEDQPGQPLLVVLSDSLWRDRYGSDPKVVGRAVTVNGEPGTIIGVMPPRFSFPIQERLWTNLRAARGAPVGQLADRVDLFGRLAPGVTVEDAATALSTVAARLARQWPATHQGFEKVRVQSVPEAYTGAGAGPILYLMLAMTGFILALACVNVANMLLGRAAERSREFAIRAAMGAGRNRLLRQVLLESLLLAALGAAAGLLLARFAIDEMHWQITTQMNVPGWFDFRLDARVAAFAAIVTTLTGLLAGIYPAMHASRVDLTHALKEDTAAAVGSGTGRLRRWLVTAQIAFSTALLVSASVLAWSVIGLRDINNRYQPDQLLSGRLEVQDSTQPTTEDRARFFRSVLDRLQAEPGVTAAAVSSRGFIEPGVASRVGPEGVVYAHENERPTVWLEVVSRDYFRMVGVTPIAGRFFDEREQSPDTRAAIVNQSMARRFWPDSNPIGQRFRTSETGDDWVTVVGVAPDLQLQGVFQPRGLNEAGYYLAQDQMGWGWLALLVRTESDPAALVDAVRAAIARIDPQQPVYAIGTLAHHTRRALRGYSVMGVMSGIFAAITLFLGAVGIYGVTTLSVSRRTREFGLRQALGATPSSVLRLVLGEGLRQVITGLAIGLVAAALLLTRIRDVLAIDGANTPFTYLAVATLIAGVALLALWLPARRATHINPTDALRMD